MLLAGQDVQDICMGRGYSRIAENAGKAEPELSGSGRIRLASKILYILHGGPAECQIQKESVKF